MLTDRQLSKLNLVTAKEYKSDSYHIKYEAYREGLLYIDFKGHAKISDLIDGFKLREKIINEAGFNNREYFEIWDYIYSPTISKEGRLIITENFSKESKNLLAIIFTNCSTYQKIIFKTGISFINNRYTINTIKKNNEEALEFGLNLLRAEKDSRSEMIRNEIDTTSTSRNFAINNFNDLWELKRETFTCLNNSHKVINNNEWLYRSYDNKFEVSISVADYNIFIIRPKGDFSRDDLNHTFRLKYNIISLLGLNNSKIYQIIDCKDIHAGSIVKTYQELNEYLTQTSELNNINIVICKNILIKSLLKYRNKKNSNKWIIKNNFNSAFQQALMLKDFANSTDIEKLVIPKKSNEKTLLIHLLNQKINRLRNQHNNEIEQTIKMLSQLAWDKYNQPVRIDKISSENLEHIYQTIMMIYNDNSDLLKQYKEKEMSLLDTNRRLQNEIIDKESIQTSIDRSKEKYKSIFNNLVDIYFEVDMKGTILEISKSVEEISKYRREDLIGTDVRKYLVTQNVLLKAFNSIIDQVKIRDFVVKFRDKDGTEQTCSINANLICNKVNKPVKVIGVLRKVRPTSPAGSALSSRVSSYN